MESPVTLKRRINQQLLKNKNMKFFLKYKQIKKKLQSSTIILIFLNYDLLDKIEYQLLKQNIKLKMFKINRLKKQQLLKILNNYQTLKLISLLSINGAILQLSKITNWTETIISEFNINTSFQILGGKINNIIYRSSFIQKYNTKIIKQSKIQIIKIYYIIIKNLLMYLSNNKN